MEIRDDTTIERLQDGKELITKNYCLRTAGGTGLLMPKTDRRIQKDDYLLVSRVPGPNGGSATIFGGLHGAGTRAVDLLLHSINPDELEYLRQAIHSAPYFQAVFKVTELAEIDNTTMPMSIALVKNDFPPVALA
jgi:hypothetical protein